MIRRATKADVPEWAAMRHALWPDQPADELRQEAATLVNDDGQPTFVCEQNGKLVGFVEIRLRDYAEGCASSPVGYIEAWYVVSEARRQGVGR
jgi:aminoglycoside 6'-N-acetyltransferase I